MGKSSATTTSQQTRPTDSQVVDAFANTNLFGDILSAADNLALPTYSGPRVADISDVSMSGINSLADTLSANPLSAVDPAINNLLSGNAVTAAPVAPALSTALNTAATDVTNRIGSQFNLAGRVGDNSAFGSSLGRGITDALATILAPAMQQDANRTLRADLANVDAQRGGINSLLSVLSGQQDLASNVIDAGNILTSNEQARLQGDMDMQAEQNANVLNELSALLNAASTVGGFLPSTGTQTRTRTPGLIDYLTLGADVGSAYAGRPRA